MAPTTFTFAAPFFASWDLVGRYPDILQDEIVGAEAYEAFKANTNDTRESPALEVARVLLDEHAAVVMTDPHALENAKYDLGPELSSRIEFEPDPYKAAEGAHAIAILTEWEQFKTLDYERLHAVMSKPAFIFDGRNLLDQKKVFEIGFNVYPIGRPALTHLRPE